MAFTPFFRSPFTDLTSTIISHQWYGRCADLEMKVVDCLEAYGIDRGLEKCDIIIKDFQECATQAKQQKRWLAMRTERDRQYSAGERSKDERYTDPPPMGSYVNHPGV